MGDVNDVMLELDPVAAAAVDLARAAAIEQAPESVGDYLGAQAEEPLVVTHTFAATVPGYVGWNWAVTGRPHRRLRPRHGR